MASLVYDANATVFMVIATYWLPLTKIEKGISAGEAVASLMVRRMQSYTVTQQGE